MDPPRAPARLAVSSAALAMAIALDEHGASMAGAATGFIVAFGLFFACLALGTLAMRAGRSA